MHGQGRGYMVVILVRRCRARQDHDHVPILRDYPWRGVRNEFDVCRGLFIDVLRLYRWLLDVLRGERFMRGQ